MNELVERSSIRVFGGLALRALLYAVLLGTISFGMMWGAARYGRAFYNETGPVEVMETVFALATAILFLVAGHRDNSKAPCAIVLSTLLFCAVIRESDYILDTLICRHAWKMAVIMVLIFLVFYSLRHIKEIHACALGFVSRPSFGILLSGILVLAVFSRLFGYGSFWKELLYKGQYRTVKKIVEEGVELMGYFLILVSSCEYLHDVSVSLRHFKSPKCRDLDGE